MPRIAAAACTAALVALPLASAYGHVAPSRDTNNRYLVLTPMRDRVRLAYTVYLGEIPGAQARQRMDTNRDRIIDDQEADAYASVLAESVRQNLQITVDGSAQPLAWAEIHTGLGTAVTSGGALSVDLIGWLCLAEDATRHTVALRDYVRVPMPGETELRIQESPGITVTGSAIGSGDDDSAAPALAFQWNGGDVPLASQGHALAFTVDPALALMPAGRACGAPDTGDASTAASRHRSLWAAVLGAAMLVLVLLGLALRHRRQPHRNQQRQKTKG